MEVLYESIQNHWRSPSVLGRLHIHSLEALDNAAAASDSAVQQAAQSTQRCGMVEDYDYWCVASINGRFSIPELHSLLDALSATTADFPDLIPEESNQTRSFSMEFSRALLQHYLHASWRYEHLTEEYLMVIDVDIAVPACCIMNGGVPDV